MLYAEQFTERRFLLLLVALLSVLVVEPLLLGPVTSHWIIDLTFSMIFFCTVFALTEQKRHRRFIVAFGVITLLGTWVNHIPFGSHRTGALIANSLGFCFMMYASYATVRAIFLGPRITFDSIFGCVAGYLLLGTAWGMLFSVVHLYSPEAFEMNAYFPQFLEEKGTRLPLFIYYSFVTLTTLGYGDICPVTPVARTLSWVEAVVGQLYVATLVAGIVGVIANATRISDNGASSKTEPKGKPEP